MNKGFFEQIHKSTASLPYIRLNDVNLSYIAHYHIDTEVIFVLFGQMTVTVDGTDTVLNKGDIFIIMPGKIHSFITPKESVCHIMKFYSPEELYSYNITKKITETDEVYPRILNIIKKIENEFNNKKEGYKIALCVYANSFLLELLRAFNLEKTTVEEKRKNKRNIEIANKIAEYFEAHFTENISLDDLSRFCGYSKYHLSHNFKEITSMNFSEFLSFFRIEKSKNQLLLDKNISEVAFACGFNNLRSFNRSFKHHTNMTPGDFIKTKNGR